MWCFFQFLRDLDDEITAIKLEEESLKRKMNGKKELQSCTKVRGTVLQYLYFSVISRFLLKTVHPFRHFLGKRPRNASVLRLLSMIVVS